MKSAFLFSILFLAQLGFSGFSALDGGTMTTKFKVGGNCNMCKKRIETAAKIDGVISAEWDKETHILTVSFDEKVVKPRQIHQAIVAVGHDTELLRADDAVYDKLHECCHYDRLH